MSYYPTFVFFEQNLTIANVAQIIIDEFGNELTEIRFAMESAPGVPGIPIRNKASALQFLTNNAPGICQFRCANDLNSLAFEMRSDKCLLIEFWDFDSSHYDDGKQPAAEMINNKKLLAVRLHEILLRKGGARFSYTSNFDHKYCGDPGHFDYAEMIAADLSKSDFKTLSRIINENYYFWLLGVLKGSTFVQTINGSLQAHFNLVYGEGNAVVFENKTDKPFFLED